MVKNISLEDNSVDIYLQINSNNENNLRQLKNHIEEKLHQNGLNEVNIYFHNSPQQSSSTGNEQKSLTQQSIPGVDNIIAIASGKGGVGKSTVAVNLAATLSKEYRVGLLDLDIYGPSLPMLVNINTQPQMTEDKKLIPFKKYNMHLMSFGFLKT